MSSAAPRQLGAARRLSQRRSERRSQHGRQGGASPVASAAFFALAAAVSLRRCRGEADLAALASPHSGVPLPPEAAPRRAQDAIALDHKVTVLQDVAISCRGQPFSSITAKPYFACGKFGCGRDWTGCGYNGGTCSWDDKGNTLSRFPYCAGDICLEHAPGTNATHTRECIEAPDACQDLPGVFAGVLDTVVILTQPHHGAYYHFLIDSMTRIWWIHEQYPEVLKDPKTFFHTGLVHEGAQTWARFAGINTKLEGSANRLIDGLWKAKTAYFPPGNGCADTRRGAFTAAVRGVSEIMRKNSEGVIPVFQNHNKPVLLVVRRDIRKAQARAVINADEVLAGAAEVLPGWLIREFSDYPEAPSIVDTCGMFASAHMIMGPHGAGFANLLCARPEVVLIEFQQKPHSYDFELLSHKLRMPYIAVPSELEHLGPGKVDVGLVKVACKEGADLVLGVFDVTLGQASRGTIVKETAAVPSLSNPQASLPGASPVPQMPQAPMSVPVVPAPVPQMPQAPMSAPVVPAPVSQMPQAAWDTPQLLLEGTFGFSPPEVWIPSGWKEPSPSSVSKFALDGQQADVLRFNNVVISCKGQPLSADTGLALAGCVQGQCGVPFNGYNFDDGTCVWNSATNFVSKEEYCIYQHRNCVQHGPGPAEADSPQCRLNTVPTCHDQSEIAGGPVEKVVVLTQPKNGAYRDFVIDSLSRLHWIHAKLDWALADPEMLFHTGLVNEAGQQWARMMGIKTTTDDNRLIDGFWRAKVAYFPPSNPTTETRDGADAVAVRGIRRRALFEISAQSLPAPSKPTLLLMRRDNTMVFSPRISNHDDVVTLIQKMTPGWNVVQVSDDLTSHSLRDRCAWMVTSSLVVGVSGPGLADAVCAKAGTPLVELHGGSGSGNAYSQLAQKLGLPYVGVDAKLQVDVRVDLSMQLVDRALRAAVSLLPAGHPGRDASAFLSSEQVQSFLPAPPPTRPPPPSRPQEISLEESKEVLIWQGGDLVVSCKGQVFKNWYPLVSCASGNCGMPWSGCDYGTGTCVWDSTASHVRKSPYCAGDICVPHGPGPAEKDTELCRETLWTQPCRANPEVIAGTLETIVVLTQPQWGAYYHFLIDGLSRVVHLLKDYPEVVRDKNTFFHVGMVNEVGIKWTQLMGITEPNRLLDGWWRAKKIYFPPGTPCANNRVGASPPVIQYMRETLFRNLPASQPAPPADEKLVLILQRSREASEARAVLNGAEMNEVVRRVMVGWTVEIFLDFPSPPGPVETCQIFKRAGLIMGMHGAGMANLVCAREGTVVFELQEGSKPPNIPPQDYVLLSSKLNLRYTYMGTDFSHLKPGNIDLIELERSLREKVLPILEPPAPVPGTQENGEHSTAEDPVKDVARPIAQLPSNIASQAAGYTFTFGGGKGAFSKDPSASSSTSYLTLAVAGLGPLLAVGFVWRARSSRSGSSGGGRSSSSGSALPTLIGV